MGLINLITENNELKNLDTTLWFEFTIKSLFQVTRPVARVATNYDEGDVPFIASGNCNNGVEKYVRPVTESESLDIKNCITVSPVDGSTFYQEFDFLGRGGAGSSIIILRNNNLNKYNALFLCTCIRKVASKYNYSNMCSASKLKNEKISLPVKNNLPDWIFMENYMKEKYFFYLKLLLK